MTISNVEISNGQNKKQKRQRHTFNYRTWRWGGDWIALDWNGTGLICESMPTTHPMQNVCVVYTFRCVWMRIF